MQILQVGDYLTAEFDFVKDKFMFSVKLMQMCYQPHVQMSCMIR